LLRVFFLAKASPSWLGESMKSSHALLVGLLGLGFSILPGQAQDLGDTVTQPGLSYQAPKGWAVKDSADSKCKICYDAPKNNYPANIVAMTDSYPKPLADYVDFTKSEMNSTPSLHNAVIIDEKPFVTAGGLQGTRLVITSTVGQYDVKQFFYFFAGDSDVKYLVTGTCLVADAQHYAPIFDASMKTFSTQ
jgi:hypothetical protein